MSATEITGDDIKAWRARKALTQAMAARRLGLAKATLQDWERGRRTPGITRGVGPEQFRRVVRTIFHTWDPKSSSVKERITLEILSTGQPRAYADSIYRGIFTIEWQGWRALQDWERGRRMWSSRAATLKSFGKALGSRWSVRSVNKPTVLGPERPTIGWRAPATSFEILVFRNSLGPLSRPRRLRWDEAKRQVQSDGIRPVEPVPYKIIRPIQQVRYARICPFCRKAWGKIQSIGGKRFQGTCPKCGASGPIRESHQEALRAWNGRE